MRGILLAGPGLGRGDEDQCQQAEKKPQRSDHRKVLQRVLD
jgi:hypothetical protein